MNYPSYGESDSGERSTTVAAIHIAPGSRLPMKSIEEVVADAGRGLVGDRYHGSRHRHVSIQSATALAEASEILGTPIKPKDTRRNITTSGGEIPSKVGHRIRIGTVELEVVRPAAPCRVLDDGIGAGAAQSLVGLAGSICRIVDGGTIRIGDSVEF